MRSAAGFHADQARRQIGEKREYLGALELFLHLNLAMSIYAVHLKHVLCQIDADCRNLHFGRSLSFSG
jgi:hypothetical protein